jgi:hypothetical protein
MEDGGWRMEDGGWRMEDRAIARHSPPSQGGGRGGEVKWFAEIRTPNVFFGGAARRVGFPTCPSPRAIIPPFANGGRGVGSRGLPRSEHRISLARPNSWGGFSNLPVTARFPPLRKGGQGGEVKWFAEIRTPNVFPEKRVRSPLEQHTLSEAS